MGAEITLGLIFLIVNTQALENGLARRPPMGWMSWERYRCNIHCDLFPDECISEWLIKRTADLIVSEGYDKLGYNYVVLDDCWLANTRDSRGELQPNSTRFPSGMLDLSRYVHSKGLKFGLYEDYGTKTCMGYPGVINHMKSDAFKFAEWEVDYVKLDGCFAEPDTMDEGYPKFGQYLNQTGRPMVYSCSWPVYQEEAGIKPNFTLIAQYCNLWRNYDDIQDSWESVLDIIDYFSSNQNDIAPNSGPGRWNDPDMLIVGNFGLSLDQAKAQMALWCVLAAPLLMSVDLANIRPEFKEILQNKKAIDINQDPLGIQGRMISREKKIEIWRRPVLPCRDSYYSYAIVFLNKRTNGTPTTYFVTLKRLGLYYPDNYSVEDVFSTKHFNGSYSSESVIGVRINPSGAVFLKFTVLPSSNEISHESMSMELMAL